MLQAGAVMVGIGRHKTILTGKLTLGDGASAEMLRVSRTGIGDVTAITGPSTPGECAYLYDVIAEAESTNGGAAKALSISGGDVKAFGCELQGLGTAGYGVYVDGSVPTGTNTLNSWEFPTKIMASYVRPTNPPEWDTLTGLTIPIEIPGGEGNCLYINTGENTWVTYDLGAVYTVEKVQSYMHYAGSGMIDGSVNGVDWVDIQPLLTGGAPYWTVIENTLTPARQIRYLRYGIHYFPLVGSEMWLGWFKIYATAGWNWGRADLSFCNIHGALADIKVVDGAVGVYACEYDLNRTQGAIYTMDGDRATYYAAAYPDEHADDNDTAAGIHHTLGKGANQAAKGDHTHEGTEIKSTGVANNWILAANGAGQAAWEEIIDQDTGGADIHLFIDGRLSALADVGRYIIPRNCTISGVSATIKDKGSAGSTIVDVHKNGTTIFTTQANRPTIPYDDADGKASGTPDITSVALGDVLTVDIDSAATGAGTIEIVIVINYSELADSQFVWTYSGQLEVESVYLRLYNRTGRTKTIKKIWLGVAVAPTGAAIIVDVLKNGTTLFTTPGNRPSIAAGAYAGSSVNVEVDQWADGEYLTYVIVQTGSTVKGSDLTVHVVYS